MGFRIEITEPHDLIASNEPVNFQAIMYRGIFPPMLGMTNRIRARTRYDKIRDGYQLVTVLGGSASISIELRNSDEDWLWREIDTAPHDIPELAHWVPINALIAWVEAKGEPDAAAYGLQQWLATHDYTIHHPGTKGEHIVEQEWGEALIGINDGFHGALNDLFTGRMTGLSY